MKLTKTQLFAVVVFLQLFGIAVASAETGGENPDLTPADPEKGLCECAAFNSTAPPMDEKPALIHPTINVNCDHQGEMTCKKLCTSLAMAAKEKGAAVLCAKFHHVERYKPSVFTRVCNNDWSYANMTAKEFYCCHDKQQVDCEQIEKLRVDNEVYYI